MIYGYIFHDHSDLVKWTEISVPPKILLTTGGKFEISPMPPVIVDPLLALKGVCISVEEEETWTEILAYRASRDANVVSLRHG